MSGEKPEDRVIVQVPGEGIQQAMEGARAADAFEALTPAPGIAVVVPTPPDAKELPPWPPRDPAPALSEGGVLVETFAPDMIRVDH